MRALQVDMRAVKETKVNTDDVHELVALAVADRLPLADFQQYTSEMKRILERKADAEHMRQALHLKADRDALDRLAESKGNAEQMMNLLEQKADIQYVNQALVLKADDRFVSEALGTKLGRDEAIAMLDRKVDLDDVQDILAKHVSETQQALAWTKRDVELVMRSKAAVADVNEMFSRVSKDFNNIVLAVDLKLDRAEFVDGMQQREDLVHASMRDREHEVAHHSEAIEALKAQVMHLARDLGRKTDADVLNRALASTRDDVSKALAECRELVQSKASEEVVASALRRKVELSEVEELLRQKASITDVALELALKANVEDVDAMLRTRAAHDELVELSHGLADLRAALEQKASRHDVQSQVSGKVSSEDLAQLRATVVRMEKSLRDEVHHASRSESGTQLSLLETELTRVRQLVLEHQANLDQKVDGREFHTALSAKADVDYVAHTLDRQTAELFRLLDLKANLGEIQGLRTDVTTLGNQVIESNAAMQTLIDSSLDELRKSLELANSRVLNKANAADVERALVGKADARTLDALQQQTQSLGRMLAAKADAGEMNAMLLRKVDNETFAHELERLPTLRDVQDLVATRVPNEVHERDVRSLDDRKLDKSQFLLGAEELEKGLVAKLSVLARDGLAPAASATLAAPAFSSSSSVVRSTTVGAAAAASYATAASKVPSATLVNRQMDLYRTSRVGVTPLAGEARGSAAVAEALAHPNRLAQRAAPLQESQRTANEEKTLRKRLAGTGGVGADESGNTMLIHSSHRLQRLRGDAAAAAVSPLRHDEGSRFAYMLDVSPERAARAGSKENPGYDPELDSTPSPIDVIPKRK